MSRLRLLTTIQLVFVGCLLTFYVLARARAPIGLTFHLWLGIDLGADRDADDPGRRKADDAIRARTAHARPQSDQHRRSRWSSGLLPARYPRPTAIAICFLLSTSGAVLVSGFWSIINERSTFSARSATSVGSGWVRRSVGSPVG